jgi:DNA-binding transcriptional ArsR family regulator
MSTDVQDRLTLTFAALADPTRRAMLARLARRR